MHEDFVKEKPGAHKVISAEQGECQHTNTMIPLALVVVSMIMANAVILRDQSSFALAGGAGDITLF